MRSPSNATFHPPNDDLQQKGAIHKPKRPIPSPSWVGENMVAFLSQTVTWRVFGVGNGPFLVVDNGFQIAFGLIICMAEFLQLMALQCPLH